MGLIGILIWPIRTIVSILTQLIHTTLSIILFPFRAVSTIYRSTCERANLGVQYIEDKIHVLKNRKPLSYLFRCQAADNEHTSYTEGEDVRKRVRSQSPDNGDEENESIASLIQDLMTFSQSESKPQLSDRQTQQEKVQLLIQELQELAGADGGGHATDQDEEGVSNILEDLSELESYLTQFLHEQEPAAAQWPDRTSSLETIIEETTSKESSPLLPSSPVPHRTRSIVPTEGTIEEEERRLLDCQNEISRTLLMLQKVTNSHELRETLQQLSEMHKQNHEYETPPSSPCSSSSRDTPTSDKERHEALTSQLTDSQLEMDNIINSLDQQQRFMSSQQELQNVMESLTIHTTEQTVEQPKTTPTESHPATPPEEQLYDRLPVYAKVQKKPHPLSNSTQEEIYDSICPATSQPLLVATDENPPPIPLRRRGSDVSTDSCDGSPPMQQMRKKRHSSEDEKCNSDCHHHHHHSRHHRKHSSHHHSCKYCDHSPDRHHSRSRERCNHHRHRNRSTSDDSQDEGPIYPRGHCESSGYDSHQDIDSPTVTRRRGRAHSDVIDPATPTLGKRGFFGFFKKSTSLTSLSSMKSDASERASVSSYKM